MWYIYCWSWGHRIKKHLLNCWIGSVCIEIMNVHRYAWVYWRELFVQGWNKNTTVSRLLIIHVPQHVFDPFGCTMHSYIQAVRVYVHVHIQWLPMTRTSPLRCKCVIVLPDSQHYSVESVSSAFPPFQRTRHVLWLKSFLSLAVLLLACMHALLVSNPVLFLKLESSFCPFLSFLTSLSAHQWNTHVRKNSSACMDT